MTQEQPWSEMMKSQNYEAAIEICLVHANQNNIDAQRLLGVMFDYGFGTQQDFLEAFKWYNMAAQQGDLKSMSALGYMYSSERYDFYDIERAFHWYTTAATRGDTHAQFILAYLLLDTEESKRDWHQAEKWFYKAAIQGHVDSYWALGILYGIEISGKFDLVKSYAWLEIAKINKGEGAVSAQEEVRGWMTKEQIQEAENYAHELLLNEFVSS